MNLAEFPLASLDDRLPKDQKTLVFEDQIQVKGEPVTRRLTISASDKYGLPTALDDEVILGLIQLTRQKGFAEKRVEFTRYELIRLLGWREEGKSYQRIDESLKRWLGVSLYYDKAWWDKDEKSWVSESFHILDNVTLYDRERYARRKKAGGIAAGCSSFSWNEIVFRNFRVGYLKRLDLQVYRSFQSAVTKRLYRFVDKRFYKKSRWEFDLQTLCFDKLGMARTDHTGLLKRRLNVGIRELVEQGFLKAMQDQERYRKNGIGRWSVILERGDTQREEPAQVTGDLVGQLRRRGLSQQSAEEFYRSRSPQIIMDRIKLHDWLVERSDHRVSRRPAGFLAQSIRHEYP
ncbi:MAG: replication initiator protein A, partial [Pirellulales bacterium]